MEWEQVDELYRLIRENQDGAVSQHQRSLLMAKLLTREIRPEQSILLELQQKGLLIDFFLEYMKMAEECRQFFEAAGNVIGSKNLSQTFQQKVAELETDLKKGYAQYEQTLQTLESDLRRIDEIKAAQEINLTLHQIHFRENEAIRNSITVGSDKGSTVNGGAVEVMEACTQKISAELKRYDEELQKLIRASEETKQRIRRLNLTEETRG